MAVQKPRNRNEFKVIENVFSEPVLRKVFQLASQGHFDALESPISIGKEANIFSAKKGSGKVVLKIYRVENCNFNRMRDYLLADYRYSKIAGRKRQVVYVWAEREYRNLMKAREVVPVPKPMSHKDNILVMEFIGDDTHAPQLKDALVKDLKNTAKECFGYIKRLKSVNLVHGDLSEFNILYWHDVPYMIDFSQCTPFDTSLGKELIERDFKSLMRFFSRRVDIDVDEARKWAGLA